MRSLCLRSLAVLGRTGGAVLWVGTYVVYWVTSTYLSFTICTLGVLPRGWHAVVLTCSLAARGP